jgi:hypothetical protein
MAVETEVVPHMEEVSATDRLVYPQILTQTNQYQYFSPMATIHTRVHAMEVNVMDLEEETEMDLVEVEEVCFRLFNAKSIF